MGVSPGSTWPLGSATTLRPSAARRTGTITMVSSPRTTTPPAENSRLRGGRRRPASIDISAQRHGIVDGEPPAPLGDDPGALERGEEAAGRLAARARELGQVGLGGGDEHVAVSRALGARLLDELAEHGGDAALHRLEALAGQALVGGAQAAPQRDDELDRDVAVLAHEPA